LKHDLPNLCAMLKLAARLRVFWMKATSPLN